MRISTGDGTSSPHHPAQFSQTDIHILISSYPHIFIYSYIHTHIHTYRPFKKVTLCSPRPDARSQKTPPPLQPALMPRPLLLEPPPAQLTRLLPKCLAPHHYSHTPPPPPKRTDCTDRQACSRLVDASSPWLGRWSGWALSHFCAFSGFILHAVVVICT
jgi:hypothetical protein